MRWGHEQAGRAVDLAAAGVLAGAAGFAAAALASGAAAALIASAALACAYAGLRRIADDRPFALASFEPAPLDPVALDPAAPDWTAAGPQPGDETVVRLFDPRQVHIARPSAGSSDFAPPVPGQASGDAGQALSDALADLKRKLR